MGLKQVSNFNSCSFHPLFYRQYKIITSGGIFNYTEFGIIKNGVISSTKAKYIGLLAYDLRLLITVYHHWLITAAAAVHRTVELKCVICK